MTQSSSLSFRVVRGAQAPMVPEGTTKGLFPQPAANFHCCLAVSQVHLLLPILFFLLSVIPLASLDMLLFLQDALGLLGLAVPEDTEGLLSAPAAFIMCSNDA